MISSAPDRFIRAFTPELQGLLVRAIKDTYHEACEAHAVAPNSDSVTFGTSLYRFAGHRLSRLAEEHPEHIALVREHPSFLHRVGQYDLFCHRVAKRSDANIWTSFPNPKTESYQRGVTLFLPGMEPGLEDVNHVVLAHMGNDEDGLYSVHLCIPIKDSVGGIEWGYTHELYQHPAESTSPMAMPSSSTPGPESVEIALPVVRRRVRSDEA